MYTCEPGRQAEQRDVWPALLRPFAAPAPTEVHLPFSVGFSGG